MNKTRRYKASDMEWMTAYSPDLLRQLAIFMQDDELGDDMCYFMHLIQVGHDYELGKFDKVQKPKHKEG